MPIEPWVVNQINFESKMKDMEERLNAITHNNFLSKEEWDLVLSCLKFEEHNNAINEIYPTRQGRIKSLIKKIEEKTN
jgi:hypothetical protein